MDTGNNRLVRIDDMNGTNWTTMSGIGAGVGQFAQYVAPVAFDASGRIYVADAGNRRLVRMDDMNGTNWTTLTQSLVINSYIYPLLLRLRSDSRTVAKSTSLRNQLLTAHFDVHSEHRNQRFPARHNRQLWRQPAEPREHFGEWRIFSRPNQLP
jgi:hypothetical protein